MARYIDADALKVDWIVVSTSTNTECYRYVSLEQIMNAPTADVVEVVRCKECRHANECHKNVQYTRDEPNTITIGYSPIEWCSRGERRE